ncbi:MAG: beta-lactamase family protein [Asgard group archaeon]|nr:beta-lactamase family protein [Asgard group archaeon]
MKRNSLLLMFVLSLISVSFLSSSNVNNIDNSISNDFVPHTNSFSPKLAGNPHNETELQLFFDDLLENQLIDYTLPGITLSVVNATDILYLKGYGYANIEESKAVSPTSTMFRIASTSKLFTWTAVMQLYEQSLLDLDENINNYLTEFKIPMKYGPITMYDLMSHSPGFEDYFFLTGSINKKITLSLEDYLIEYMPKCVRSPGEVSSYSNYGVSLAGYIVGEISGKPFPQYVEEEILIPLGMDYSTFLNSLPSVLEENLVTEYSIDKQSNLLPATSLDPYNLEYDPAGSLKTTALDISYFMRAHLNNGSFGSNRILEEATVQEMHNRHFSHHPNLDGFAHGFFELTINGKRILTHGGSVSYTRSELMLIPEEQIGFFISYNAYHIDPVYTVFYEFMDHFYPGVPVSRLEPDPNFKQTGKKFTGNFRYTRGPYNTPAVINYLIEYKHVSIDKEGYLVVSGFKYVQVEELLFREPEYDFYLAFKEDAEGKITHMFYSHVSANALEKLTGADNPPIAWSICITIVVIILASLIYIPIRRKIKREEKYIPDTEIERYTKLATQYTGWGIIGFVVLYGGFSVILLVSEAVFPVTRALLVIPYILVFSLLVLIGLTAFLWINKQGSINIRVNATIIAIVAIVFMWWMVHWRLIGFFYA